MGHKILLVEDDPCFGSVLKSYLELSDYDVIHCTNGVDGFEAFRKEKFDLCLLDVMMPEMDGFTLGKKIRELDVTVPFVYITAKSMKDDMKLGYEIGSDDYIVKPFAIEELLARVRALLRRISIEDGNNKEHQTTVNYKDLTIEKENRVVRRGDEVINLTKREYELLLILMENINVVMSRKDLLSKVWGYDSKVETNVVDVYIRYLRNKIDRPGEKSYIQTVRGTGYVIRS